MFTVPSVAEPLTQGDLVDDRPLVSLSPGEFEEIATEKQRLLPNGYPTWNAWIFLSVRVSIRTRWHHFTTKPSTLFHANNCSR